MKISMLKSPFLVFCFLLVNKTLESSELTGGKGSVSKLMALHFFVVIATRDSYAHPNNVFRAVVGYQDKRVNCEIFLGEVHISSEKNC